MLSIYWAIRSSPLNHYIPLSLSVSLSLSSLFVPGHFPSSKTRLISHHLLSWHVCRHWTATTLFPLAAASWANLPLPACASLLVYVLTTPSGQPQHPGLFSHGLTLPPLLRSASHPWAKTRRKDLGLFSLEKKGLMWEWVLILFSQTWVRIPEYKTLVLYSWVQKRNRT